MWETQHWLSRKITSAQIFYSVRGTEMFVLFCCQSGGKWTKSTDLAYFAPFADGAVETVITFDQGAKWQRLQQPLNSLCDTETSTNRPKKVRHTARLWAEWMSIVQHVWQHMPVSRYELFVVCPQCRLHIHASYSTTMKMNVPMLPLSQPNAVGLILAHGKIWGKKKQL